MKNRMISRNAFLFILLLSTPLTIFGQVKEFPVPVSHFQPNVKKASSARTTQIPLELPFWEDFSSNYPGTPSDSLWVDSDNIFINNHFGFLPPSQGIATFDGLQADGTPYSNDPESSERNDRLTSNFIDLSGYDASDNIYLSFFYQAGGYGEAPDPVDGDVLMVEFINADSEWVQAHVIEPEAPLDPQEFYQVLIPIDNEIFFHDKFQFSISNFGNQSGTYDVWNIDYIYINNNRSTTDKFYPDRTIIHGLSNIFGEYASIPRIHLDFEKDYEIPYYSLKTLYNTFQTYRQQVTIMLHEEDDSMEVVYGQTTQGTETPIFPNEIDTITLSFPLTSNGFPEIDSSIYRIDFEVAVNTYDNRIDSGNYNIKYAPIDFRVNDTLRQSFIFQDYYAYDDGSAESSAGLEVTGNTMAYLFTLRNTDSTYIHGIDINTIYSGSSGIGKKVDLHIWNYDEGKPGKEVYKEEFTISGDDSRTAFSRYSFRKPVLVKDTFFIGLTLKSAGRLPMGLDKSSDNADKIFEIIDKEWLPIGNRITGSIMMRPFIGPKPIDPVTNVEGDVTPTSLHIFPNPSKDGLFYIKGDVEHIKIKDISGKDVQFQLTKNPEMSEVIIMRKGIYIISVIIKGSVIHRKVIVE